MYCPSLYFVHLQAKIYDESSFIHSLGIIYTVNLSMEGWGGGGGGGEKLRFLLSQLRLNDPFSSCVFKCDVIVKLCVCENSVYGCLTRILQEAMAAYSPDPRRASGCPAAAREFNTWSTVSSGGARPRQALDQRRRQSAATSRYAMLRPRAPRCCRAASAVRSAAAHAVAAARHQQEPATTPRRHQRNKKAAAGVSPRREESKGAPANKKAVTKLPLAAAEIRLAPAARDEPNEAAAGGNRLVP